MIYAINIKWLPLSISDVHQTRFPVETNIDGQVLGTLYRVHDNIDGLERGWKTGMGLRKREPEMDLIYRIGLSRFDARNG